MGSSFERVRRDLFGHDVLVKVTGRPISLRLIFIVQLKYIIPATFSTVDQ
jgi:hypothetical protein